MKKIIKNLFKISIVFAISLLLSYVVYKLYLSPDFLLNFKFEFVFLSGGVVFLIVSLMIEKLFY